MPNLCTILKKASDIHTNKTALIFNDNYISYSTLREGTERLAAGLKALHLGRGDRIALMLPNVPHFIMSYFALLQAGITIVPVSIYYKSEEILHLLEDSEARGIIYWEGFRDQVDQILPHLAHLQHRLVLTDAPVGEEVRLNGLIEQHEPLAESEDMHADDTALVVYTAGATGRPIGAELTHANILFDIQALQQTLKPESGSLVLAPIPFYHPLGHTLTMGTFLGVGATLALMSKFDADEIFHMIERVKPQFLVAVPAMIRDMLQSDRECAACITSLKCVLVSGEAMKSGTMETFEKRYRVPILEGYGLTEGSMVSFNSLWKERTPGSIGLPLPGIEMKIVDEEGMEVKTDEVGELLVRGPNVMKGYLNRPEATKKALRDGWLHTGDLVQLRENGFGFVVVRKKNVIIKSGFNVYPREVEKYLLAHPKIREAVIVGLPDPVIGEEIHACIVLKENETATAAEIIAYSRERLAAYKCPKTVTFFDDLPKGPNGRILRTQIKEMLSTKIVNIGNYQ